MAVEPPVEGLDDLEYRALVPLYEQAREADPSDIAVLSWLGHAYTRLGRIEEGLAVDRELTQLQPEDPTARYNLACSFALLGRVAEALDALETAVALGYRDPDHMRSDPDLERLRAEPRFRKLLQELGG
jgi:Flp pilus assembly protein TadD